MESDIFFHMGNAADVSDDVSDVSVLFTKYMIQRRGSEIRGALEETTERTDLTETALHDLKAAGFENVDERIRKAVDVTVEVDLPGRGLVKGIVLVSIVPDIRLMGVGVGFKLAEVSVDEMIFLQRAIKWDTSGRERAIKIIGVTPDLGQSVLDRLASKVLGPTVDEGPSEYGTVFEIRGLADGCSAKTWVDRNVKPLYGIITGDEGWSWVPSETAKERLKLRWSTRNFVTSVVLDRTLLQVSCKPDSYSTELEAVFTDYGYTLPPHLGIGSEVPGLEHGGLFSMERVMARSLTIKELEEAAAEFSFSTDPGGVTGFLRSVFSSNRAATSLHFQLADGLARIEEAPWWELNRFDRILRKGFQIERRIERLKWWLGLADAAAQLRYQARMNNLVILLTFVIATVQIVVAFLAQ